MSFGEKTLAVMGFGKVGSEVARRAKFLGMKVIAHDPYAPADRARAMGIELVTFDEALSRADFISLHMPLTPATSKIMNDEAFAKMKKGVRIVNVARGGVIDEDALVRALDAGIVEQVLSVTFCPFTSCSNLLSHDICVFNFFIVSVIIIIDVLSHLFSASFVTYIIQGMRSLTSQFSMLLLPTPF